MPKNVSFFFEYSWLMLTNNQPVSIHRIIKIKNKDKLLHEQWLFEDHQLTKVDEQEIMKRLICLCVIFKNNSVKIVIY